ncbi:MAG: hypothetical protein H6948_16265 [Zoogloeaceae bacterium]|nr:hypothetical protein [Zoogloeaceae bacterium]
MVDADTGEVAERLEAIVQACGSYTEWSPSGTGVHVIGLSGVGETFKSNKVGIEVFAGRQFFTFTGGYTANRWTLLRSRKRSSGGCT